MGTGPSTAGTEGIEGKYQEQEDIRTGGDIELVVDDDHEVTLSGKLRKKKHYVSERIDNILLKSLPPINYDAADLHNNHIAFPSSTLYIATWIALFAYLFNTGVETATGSQFLSVDGTSDSQVCEDVPQPVTGTFKVDKYGTWDVEEGYQRNSSFLEFQFYNSEITLQQYTAAMERFRETIIGYDDKIKTRDLSYAMLTWLNIDAFDAGAKISMKTTAQYEKIFANFKSFSSSYEGFQIADDITGPSADPTKCYTRDPTTTTKFDSNAGTNRINPPFVTYSADKTLVKFSWNLDDLRLNNSVTESQYNSFDTNVLQPCGSIFRVASNNEIPDPVLVGSLSQDGYGKPLGDYTRDFDIRSIVVACAVNKGIISTDKLIEDDFQPIGYEEYNLKLYTYAMFPGIVNS